MDWLVSARQQHDHDSVHRQLLAVWPYVCGPVSWCPPRRQEHDGPGNGQLTCTSTTGLPIAGLNPGESLTLVDLGFDWQSDYWALTGNPSVRATDFTGAVSLDGMSFTGVATF